MLRIGGLLPLSLCDYPGRVAAVVFTRGCNFRCPFCHNGHLLEGDPTADLPPEAVLDRLTTLGTRLQGVVVTGGEPTIQPGLAAFIRELRARRFSVKLDTNGSHPEVLEALLEESLLDFIAMDIKAPWARYPVLTKSACDIAAVRRSVAILAASGRPHQFRTTHVPQLLTDDDCEAIVRQLPAGSPHIFQPFLPEHALDPALRT